MDQEKLLWKCDFCDYRTLKKHELDDHTMQVHTMERPFKCDQCDYACTNERKLKEPYSSIWQGQSLLTLDIHGIVTDRLMD